MKGPLLRFLAETPDTIRLIGSDAFGIGFVSRHYERPATSFDRTIGRAPRFIKGKDAFFTTNLTRYLPSIIEDDFGE